MLKKNIVIVGFPKSGTTWASRLVAELIQCPIQGDWGYEHIDALYKEGVDRKSQFQCFKSHHTFQEIDEASTLPIHKIIYIVRDPRDIVISGVHYFSFSTPFAVILKKIHLHKIEQLSRKIYDILLTRKGKKKKMIHAVLHGDKNINYWFKTSWQEHHRGYANRDILFIKYEDLLDFTENECIKIMKYLDIETTTEHLKKSIQKQSFQKRKQEVAEQSNASLKKLIRKGSYGYWKEEFTKKELDLFSKTISTNIYQF